MSEVEEKKLVYISKSLIDRVTDIARKQGVSLTKIIEDSIRHFLELCELGYNTSNAIEILRAYKILRVLGGIYIPKPILECIENNTCGENILDRWREIGRAYGLYLKWKTINPVRTLETLLEVMRWDLSLVEADKKENTYRIKCVSPLLSENETNQIVEFIKGILEGINATSIKVNSVKGIILVEFKT